MATVKEIFAKKGAQVYTIGPEAMVLEAAHVMNQHKIGALVVLQEGRVVGMFTERDVLRRVVAEQREPAKTPVSQVMSREVVCGTLDTSIEEARVAMKNRRIRHLPIVNGGQLVGLISIGDLNAFQADDQEQTIYLLQEYLYGRV